MRTVRTRASLRQGRDDWFRIENAADDAPATLYIYDEIGWFGVTAADLVNELKAVKGDLAVHINSPGGDVFDGIAVLNALRSHKGTVTTIVDGLAASAASFIAQAGSVRVMAKNSRMMIHDAMGMCIGNVKDMAEMTNLLEDASNNIAGVYAERSNRGDVRWWREQMQAETWYSPAEAVAVGLADRIDTPNEPAAPEPSGWDLAAFAKYASRELAPPPALPPDPTPVAPSWNLDSFKKGLGV